MYTDACPGDLPYEQETEHGYSVCRSFYKDWFTPETSDTDEPEEQSDESRYYAYDKSF